MSRLLRTFGALLAASLVASCDAGGSPVGSSSSASPGVVVSATPVTSPASSCARQGQARRLLQAGDVWPVTELDAWSQIGYHLDATCDQGPPWPRECDPFGDVLSEGWRGYRTEGAGYVAAISLLNTSGQTVEEQVLLFATRSSSGLAVAASQARACHATTKTSQDATVYLFPKANAVRRALIVDQTAAIMLKAPADIDIDKLIAAALRRERTAK